MFAPVIFVLSMSGSVSYNEQVQSAILEAVERHGSEESSLEASLSGEVQKAILEATQAWK